jgi:hypothetical protein
VFGLAVLLAGLTRRHVDQRPARLPHWTAATGGFEALGHTLGTTLTLLLSSTYGFSCVALLAGRATLTPDFFDLAFSRTMQAFLAAADAVIGG